MLCVFVGFDFHRCSGDKSYDGDIRQDSNRLSVSSLPFGHVHIDVCELENRADDTHECAAGDESGRDKRTLLLSCSIDLLITASRADEPRNRAADDKARVDLGGRRIIKKFYR